MTESDRTQTELPNRGQAAVADLISALERVDGQLAAREQRVADYVKANIDSISTMTIAELAGAADVSTPTVIRFCRSLGCDGFKEFKLRLAQNLAVSLQYIQADVGEEPANVENALDHVLAAIYATTNVMRKQLDPRQLEGAKAAIIGCKQLLVAGMGGGSSVLAQEGANRFFRLGITTMAVNDSYILQMRAATLRPDDTLLLFSASGETDAIVAAAKVAGAYGARTICISKPGTRLADVVSIPIVVDLPEDPHIFKPTATRYAFLAILDAIAMSVAYETRDETTENLRRIRSSLTAYHGRTGPQPLGD
ncbi:MAG: MurR/RpiR family transcriptional regulator [Roseibium sp.]|uniref:MurR/RpiR family transcriptional regulator n=1 Tax=Roseibium sp. TaxID=1936156 RepID=UPI00262C3178|nr:MurR/RpiR family transcriptional regulator [Roseibium sp.]MCV0425630.1 MurR/RpiR family transcriptional regulator [Roseibium sp.]